MSDFLMPSLGADMTEGTLLDWLVKPGDTVHRGDVIAVVDTSKAEIEIEVFEDGVIDELVVEAGMRVPVGTVLARLRPVGAEAPEAAPAVAESPPEPAPAAAPLAAPISAPTPVAAPVAVASAPPAAFAPREHRIRISPIARRMAESAHVDVEGLHGSGPAGAIVKADVEAALAALAMPAAPAPAAPDRRASAAEATAALMARSKREIPHYYLGLDIDMAAAAKWLAAINAERPVAERLLPAALLTKAVALAAKEIPEVNGFWTDGAFHASDEVNVGIAVSLRGGGIVAPAIRNAPELSLDEVMHELRDLVKRTRAGRLRSGEMSTQTITITNLGDRGVDYVQGVIYPPQVALVGFGRIREAAWAVDGMLAVRPIVKATLAADHRVTEGHRGGLFLSAIERLLQAPEGL